MRFQSALFLVAVLLNFTVKTGSANTLFSCSMGSYRYTGPAHSDTYNLPGTNESEACLARQAMDSNKIGTDYRQNRAAIESLIEKMLNNPECVDVKALLQKYQNDLLKHKNDIDDKTEVRSFYVKEKIAKDDDIQRAFAYLGAFNATCSGGHNRKTSFINLDLINKIPEPTAKPTKISENGQNSESCADVEASGTDHLKSFEVSMKKAKGETFIFKWEPYGIPDKVTVRSSSGGIIFDSGCKGSEGSKETENLTLPVPKGGSIIIDVVNNCENPSGKGMSVWDLRIKCAGETELQCKEPKEELIKLLKQEVEYTKKLLDANQLHRQCLMSIDSTILDNLIDDGLITLEEGPLENGLCETMDEECLSKIANHKAEDGLRKQPVLPYRDLSSDQDQFRCPEKPAQEESILKRISRAYCRVGWRKLGIEKTHLD